MLKARKLFLLSLAVALVFTPAAAALAGGGAGASITTTLFDCFQIRNAPDSPYTVRVTDQFGTRDVILGRARVICTPTSAAEVVRGPDLNGDFNEFLADHIKCYDAFVVHDRGPGVTATLIDPFATEDRIIDFVRMLCAPAQKLID